MKYVRNVLAAILILAALLSGGALAASSFTGYISKDTYVYKKASTGSGRKTTLSKGQHVVVYQVKGSWAYIKTLSGTGGYVKKSNLKKA